MTGPVDCQVFGDQMDALVRGTLPAEGARQLRLHASECQACALQLRVQEHLVGPSLEALEARVPGALLETMEDRVMAAVRRGAGSGPAGGEAPRGFGGAAVRARAFLVPGLAAAAGVLLFSTALLVREVGTLRERAEVLALELAAREARLAAEADRTRPDPVARTAALAGTKPFVRALARRKTITVEELLDLLGQIPSDRVVLTAAQVSGALRTPSAMGTPILREIRGHLSLGGEVRAGELVRALEASGVGRETTLETADLVDLLS